MRRINSKGFSLPEVLITAGLSITLVLGVGMYITSAYKSIVKQRVISSRNRIASTLVRIAGMASSLRYTQYDHPENSELEICTKGVESHMCENSSQFRDFKLYGPFATRVGTQVKTSGALSGTAAQPVLFGLDGTFCDTSLDTCNPDLFPIEVTTQFRVGCPPMWHEFWNNVRGANVAVVDRSSFNGDVFPNGFISPDQCYYSTEAIIYITLKPASGQTGNGVLGQVVDFPPLKTWTYVDSQWARLNYTRHVQ